MNDMKPIQLLHNGQNNHNKRRNSKVPVRELPLEMPQYQHSVYPELYNYRSEEQTCYKWECVILDLDRTIIHGKRLSAKRWEKYVKNGTIPSLAENQCGKWHRHIHRKGHQMHPFTRGRTMIYYRPFTWHLLAVLDYLKSHFGTKIIVCTKAGEHYAASVIAALISNFTSANPDLIDDVYNFHDLHDDPLEDGKPKKPFRLICNRHNVSPSKTLIVDDNATSWFGDDREITNFWMPPCYGYQIHDIDNELQLLCKYLWDPIQQNHLKKKTSVSPKKITNDNHKSNKRYQEEHNLQIKHIQHHSQGSVTTDSTISPNSTPNISPKNQRFLSPKSNHSASPNASHRHPKKGASHNGGQVINKQHSNSYEIEADIANDRIILHNKNTHNQDVQIAKIKFADLLDGAEDCNKEETEINQSQSISNKLSSLTKMARSYNKRKYKNDAPQQMNATEQQKTKKKYFFESKSRGSKKFVTKIIGK